MAAPSKFDLYSASMFLLFGPILLVFSMIVRLLFLPISWRKKIRVTEAGVDSIREGEIPKFFKQKKEVPFNEIFEFNFMGKLYGGIAYRPKGKNLNKSVGLLFDSDSTRKEFVTEVCKYKPELADHIYSVNGGVRKKIENYL